MEYANRIIALCIISYDCNYRWLMVIIYYSKKKMETDFEKDIKQLRKLQISGQLDKNSFYRLKNRMNVENLSKEQKGILENLHKEQKIDTTTYMRMKKALQLQLNVKLKKMNALN